MANNLVPGQTAGSAATASGNVTVSLPVAVTAGNLVTALIAAYSSAALTNTVTDQSGTIAFTRATTSTWNSTWDITTEVWYLANAPASVTGVKVVGSIAGQYTVGIAEFSGADTVAPLAGSPATSTAVASGTAADSGACTPTADGALLFGGGANGGWVESVATGNTVGAGYSTVYNPASSLNYIVATAEYLIQGTAAAQSASFTLSRSSEWWAQVAAFKVAGPAAVFEQNSYRWRNDDGSETTATWLASQGTDLTQPVGTNTRLRVLVGTSAGDPPAAQFQLEWQISTAPGYTPVLASQPALTLPTWVAEGAFVSGTAAITVAVPAGYQAGDLLMIFVETANQAMTTPTGWTQVTNSPQSTGTAGAAGGVRLTVFYKVATASEASVALADSGDHQTAIMAAFRGVDPNNPFNTTAGKVDSTATTADSWPAVTTTLANCLIVNAIALDRDAASTTNLSAIANASLSNLTKRHDQTVTAGAGGGIAYITGGLAAAGSSGTTTATDAASTTHAYLTLALAPVPVTPQPLLLATSANITAGGTTATTAHLTAPGGESFAAGLMSDDTNPLASLDLALNQYTELEWCLQANSNAATGDVYQFRITRAGTVLDTYTVTPQWTIGTAGPPPPAALSPAALLAHL